MKKEYTKEQLESVLDMAIDARYGNSLIQHLNEYLGNGSCGSIELSTTVFIPIIARLLSMVDFRVTNEHKRIEPYMIIEGTPISGDDLTAYHEAHMSASYQWRRRRSLPMCEMRV